MLIHALAAACGIAVGFGSIGTILPDQPPAAAAEAAAAEVAGSWAGVIKLPGMEMKIQVQLTSADGKWGGTIDIPQQGAKGLALEEVRVDGGAVSFRIAKIPGEPTFRGKQEGANRIAGEFSQNGQVFAFELARGALAAAKRPQNPVAPLPYSEEKLTVANGELKLAGTLTVPAGAGPFPAVILATGSGPQNRDEEVFEHRPFAVWADYLSRHGIAVLRFDDRGVDESTGDYGSATTSMLSTDAEAWIAVLKGRKDVGTVGIMGHSEGGIIAPMVGARNRDVGFVIMLAGPGVNGGEVLVEQNRALAIAGGAAPEAADRIAASAKAVFDAFGRSADAATIRRLVIEMVAAQTGKPATDPEVQATAEKAIVGLEGPWFREFISHDPATDLRKLTVPTLAIFGERDIQVVATQNRPAVEAAFKASGNPRATVRVVPGVNHLFQKCQTGSVEEYGKIETTVDPEVLEMVAGWIVAEAGSRR